MQTTCTQPLETWTLFKQAGAYTVIPGVINTGNIYSDYDTFLSIQMHVPIPKGPVLVSFLLIAVQAGFLPFN